MVDYIRSTGNSGQMMIRDNGLLVEFWINANNSSTYAYDMPWGYTINGVTSGWQEFRYNAGAGWKRLGYWNVWSSQTVTFRLGSTGTSGLGGPTTFSQYIGRSTVPAAPSIVTLSNVTSTSVKAFFYGVSDGGQPILEWQIGYGTDPGTPQNSVTYPGSEMTIGGLTPGTTYYFWARGRNTHGWGSYGPRNSATTLRVPDAPSTPVISAIKQTSVEASFAPNGDGGAPISAFQVGWSKNPSAPTSSMTAVSPQLITGLDPATTYHFWVRAQNAVGWGPWSAASVAATIAGARIKVGPVWKDAVPYVKHNGVWKVARPMIRVSGEWKETT